MAGGKRSKWMAHVKKTMKAHKGKSLKQVLKLAGKTYKKTGGAGPGFASEAGFAKRGGASLSPADYSGAAPAAPTEGGRRRRGTRKTRKGGRKH